MLTISQAVLIFFIDVIVDYKEKSKLLKRKDKKMKNYITVTATVFLLTAGLVAGSIAGHSYHGYGMKMNEMSNIDSNNDNAITFDEFSAPTIERLKSGFKMLDTDNDDVISKKEWEEFLKVHGYEVSNKS